MKTILLFTTGICFAVSCTRVPAQEEGTTPLAQIALAPVADTVKMAEVKSGVYTPFFGKKDTTILVRGFMMDVVPVTNRRFLEFVKHNPQWRRSQVKHIYAEANYLVNWANDTTLSPAMDPEAPVTNISWFAAKAYCDAAGKSLPTVDQWEYAAMADKTSADARNKTTYNKDILSWYEKPNTAGNRVHQTPENVWGIADLHGLVWEWTADFNEVMLSGESRKDVSNDAAKFCGSGSVGATDLMNYAAFMRYAFRGSLKANYCVQNQGFRAVKNL
ncbi:formylglycine-generating enzyme family protein [Chitinophaga sancti]|uniref:Formylglycine-generating enzyme family protein n=1 Tax=Chitinophaga sancti TaxID=1004 RepID=A0A1K1QP91_9BACT|nr:formylglycine-generating enzyme family protein [Chitinophaga sancti]WQD65102.1 formylglycine-generating enzyme family protein [Chitinophaga sancti]WQG89274.1 formylglycine-generating enzyme family protein [Chitinophaga sancti]SFW61054.1 Formylglycine-generating enzyme, required for sulfatase activity, contains SUMF1/FGE domain [Chitinophaga sancti]